MANPKIRAKRSSVEGKVPSTTQLERGEFAVNTYDGKVYVVKDQYSVGIATTTISVNPWDEPNGIGAGVSYSGSVTATSFAGDGSALTNLNVAGVSTFSGNYNHLFNKPTIPTNNNQLTNGAGYITSADGGDAATLDGLDSTSFLRSDAVGTKTSGDLTINDGVDFRFGTGSDLNIGHNGSSSNISQTGTGPLLISNFVDDSYISIRSDNGSGGIANYFQADGSTGEAILYYYGTQKLATKSTGIDVTGNITVSGTVDGVDVAALSSTVAGIDTSGFSSGTIPTNNNQLTNGAGYITGYTVTSSDVTGHQGDITITESQISDLGTYATQSYVNTQVSNLVDSAPSTLDTLNELAAALGDDENFSTTVTNSIATKMPLAGGTFSGNVEIGTGIDLNTDGSAEFAGQITGNGNIVSNRTSASNSCFQATLNGASKVNITAGGSASFAGNITVTGTVDSRDVAADGSKLDGIEAGATGDQTASEILTALLTVDGLGSGLNADLLDGLHEGSFLRSDTSTTKTSGHTRFNDGASIQLGNDGDFVANHNGTNTHFENYTGGLYLDQHTDNGVLALRADDSVGGLTNYVVANGSTGEVQLSHYGTQKLATKSTGVDVTGTITADGLDMEDDQKILLGNSDDVEIYYNQSNNKFRIDADCGLQFGINGEKSITAATNGNVELYYDDSKKLETTTSGVTVTGTLTATTFSGSGAGLTGISFDLVNDTTPQLGGDLNTNGNLIQFGDSSGATDDRLQFGASQDLQIYHNGADSYISQQGTGNITIGNTTDDQDVIITTDNGSGSTADYFRADGSTGEVILYHYGTQKLATKSTGVDVTGEVQCDSLDVDGAADITGNVTLHANLDLQDNDKILIGTGDDLEIYHDGTNSYVSNTTVGHLIVEQTSTGDLILRNTTDDRDVIIQTDDGSGNTTNYIRCEGDTGEVGLYHYGDEKIATKSTGIDVTGNITVSGTVDGVDVAALSSTVAGIDTSGFSSGTIPTNNNQLTNGAGYITASSVPTNNNQLTNGQGFITGYTVTSSDVTQHEGDITITESQISDLGSYLTSSDLSSYATQSYVNTQVSNLVDSAPGTLDTLNELAAALGDDENFSTTVTDSIATKMPLAGGTFTGAVTFASGQTFDYNNLTNTPTVPTNNNQLTNGAGYITNSVSGDLTLTDTATNSSAGPEFLLYRNSSSPSSGDYIGQIKFQGESTSGSTRLYAKITGKIGDPTNGSEDGIIEIAHRKNGSNNISGRWNQDELQLLNGTELSLGDSQKIKLGDDDDLQIYHDGNNSFISDTGTGNLVISGGGYIELQNANQNEYYARFISNGGSEFYFNNSKKFEVVTDGVDVTGEVQCDSLDVDGAADITGNVVLHNHLDLYDNNHIRLGNGDDLKIYHDGSNNVIKTAGNQNLQLYSLGTGAVEVMSDAPKLIFNDVTGGAQIDFSINTNTGVFTMEDDTNSDTFFKYTQNGAVELNYDNSKKFETTTTGATVTGTFTVSSSARISGASVTLDNSSSYGNQNYSPQLFFKNNASSNNFYIWKDGSNNLIEVQGTDDLIIRSRDSGSDIKFESRTNQVALKVVDNAAVELYHGANGKKFETTSSGVTVTGTVAATSFSGDGSNLTGITASVGGASGTDYNDDVKVRFGNSNDLQIYHDGLNSYIRENGTGSLIIDSNGNAVILRGKQGEDSVVCNKNGSVDLYYNNSKKLNTTSTGINVTGNLVASGDITSNSDISLKDNVVTYENALDKILAMRGVEYDRNDLDGKHEVGLIAQEVEKIIPEVVGEREGIKNIAYGKLTAVLIEAIKEQQQQINDLRQQLNKGK